MTDKPEYDYEKLASKLINGLDYFRSSEWQAMAENYRNMMEGIGNAVKQFYESEAIQSIGRLAKQMEEYTISIPDIKIPKIDISESTYKEFQKIVYLQYLEKIQWPLFLLIDDELMSVLEPYMNGTDVEQTQVKQAILDFLNDDYVLKLSKKWEHKTAINPARIPALNEAVKMYMDGYFYGCTALLLCQFEGIVSDIYKMEIDAGREFTLEDLKSAYKYYNPDKKLNSKLSMNSEKNQLLAILSETDGGFLYWFAGVGYLYKVIMTSSGKMSQSEHPCRNKICHGIQLNYGTREHALKAILIIDMTIKLGKDMKRILETDEEIRYES